MGVGSPESAGGNGSCFGTVCCMLFIASLCVGRGSWLAAGLRGKPESPVGPLAQSTNWG